jgi:hypothetical protein
MGRFAIICVSIIILACSKQKTSNSPEDTFLTSSYDYTGNSLGAHKEGLRELSDSKVFGRIHTNLVSGLNAKQQAYFAAHPDYELLDNTHGDLFENNKDDHAFVVYDKKLSIVKILVYDEQKDTYLELYRDTGKFDFGHPRGVFLCISAPAKQRVEDRLINQHY